MKKLIDAVDTVVADGLAGLVRSSSGLALLPGRTVVVRSDIEAVVARGEVTLVAGGGSGHEPAHAGYVGPGMLSAAVCGEVFTSPSTDAVLDAIRAVASPAGVLVIVKNYTGDRLNFGLAVELARAAGIPAEMVVVADDAALAASDDHAGRRGLAGTVLVHKIAGAAAAAGESLAAVRAAALEAIADVASMGVALSSCTVPAVGRPGFELGAGEVELGLGIHGEPGVRRMPLAPASALVRTLLDALVADRGLSAGERVALLVNNLGATPAQEIAIVTGAALARLDALGIVVERAWSGSFMTALDMSGVSLSLLRVDAARLARLDAPALTAAWPAAHLGRVGPLRVLAGGSTPAAALSAGSPPAAIAGAADPGRVRLAIRAICAALVADEDRLTRLDQAVGDGDLGLSLARGARALDAALETYPADHLPALLRAVSASLREALGGTSGPLYAIGLLRAAAALETMRSRVPPASFLDLAAAALTAAAAAISELGGAVEGDRTMLDALLPAARTLGAAATNGGSPGAAWIDAVDAAAAGSAATAAHRARRGRASYLGERAVGHVDPGAEAVIVWMRALAPFIGEPQRGDRKPP